MSNYILSHAITESFRSAMNNRGITAPAEIYADNIIHRFNVNGDKSTTKNGWYVIFPEQIISGAFGCWKRGVSFTWCERSFQQIPLIEWSEHKKKVEEVKRQLKEERVCAQNHAADRAQYIYNHSRSADPFHPYLKRKLIKPLFARQTLNNLILPIIDFDRQIWSLQFIPNANEFSVFTCQ